MNAIITYASWFGHNRAIAEMLTEEFATLGISVACVPAYRVTANDLVGRDLLVLGTYTHSGHASKNLRRLCDAIPQKHLERIAVAIFGTHLAEGTDANVSDGISDLATHLAERGCELIVPPLRIGLSREAAVHRSGGFDETEQRQIWEFACDLHDACVPAPLI
ncbi:MAG TPA: flavodoxin domain-containing protein [Roseiflexaceae bacterium]|nr:flavodoxin domain-containing protein [Roseiflexaceae bacterium]